MKLRGFLLPVLVMFFISVGVEAQQFLLVENRHNLKNYKYYVGDMVRLRAQPDSRIVEGIIYSVSDSSISIFPKEEVFLSEVIAIYRQRIGIKWLQGALLLGGAAYFSVDSFNRLINNQAPVILTETAVISAGMVSTGLLLQLVQYKRVKSEKWDLRVIDFSALESLP